MIRASCKHEGAPIVVRAGGLACSRCDAPIVVDAPVAPAGTTEVYSTRATRGPLPPGRSRRWFREHAPEMAGATRTGPRFGHAVTWTISREAYERWSEARTSSACAAPERAPIAETAGAVIAIDEWITRAGYRPTRSRRGT